MWALDLVTISVMLQEMPVGLSRLREGGMIFYPTYSGRGSAHLSHALSVFNLGLSLSKVTASKIILSETPSPHMLSLSLWVQTLGPDFASNNLLTEVHICTLAQEER